MLYLILPPIIIIVALVALVYFFSRKFPSVEKEITAHLDVHSTTNAVGIRVFDTMKRVALYVLERLAQWFKVMALRSYNALHNWTQALREKKSKAFTAKPAITLLEEASGGDNKLEARHMQESQIQDRQVRPMISQRVTHPEEKVKPSVAPAPVIKNQLEDILVERIAANPRDLEAYERLGEYYMEQGNLQDAKECYRQVLRLSPVHRLAKIKIRRLEKMLEKK
jgi:tetratricopeptide (TPR) repeat protein